MAAVAGAGLVSACEAGEPKRVAVGPAPKLLWVKVSRIAADGSIQDADAAPPLEPSGASDVAASTRIELKFDRYMLPTDAIRQAVCLRSQPGTVANANECSNGVFFHPTYDPVRRVVTYYQDASQGPVMQAGQVYTLTVLPGSGLLGFQAFDGVSLDQRYELSFTPAAPPPGTQLETPPQDSSFCGPLQGAIDVCGNCHSHTASMPSPMGLSLLEGDAAGTASDLRDTAIGKVALETEEGGAAQHPTEHPRRFGVSMAIIAPSDPGQSYLLYKILASRRFPLDPSDPSDVIAPGEADRLRLSVVTGDPMPEESVYLENYLGVPNANAGWFNDAEIISAWIAGGAQLPTCP